MFLNGSGYADGYSAIGLASCETAWTNNLDIHNVLIWPCGTGIKMDGNDGPYGATLVNNKIRFCGTGITTAGCSNTFIACAVYNPQGSPSYGIVVNAAPVGSTGEHTFIGCHVEGDFTSGYDVNTGLNTFINPYFAPGATPYRDAFTIDGMGNRIIGGYILGGNYVRIGENFNTYDTEILGTNTYLTSTDYRAHYVLGTYAYGTYIQASGKFRNLNITDSSSDKSHFYTKFVSSPTTPTGIFPRGSIWIDTDSVGGGIPMYYYDGSVWKAFAAMAA